MLSLSKTGNGALVLSGQNTFTTGFNLTAGALIFGANSTPTTGTVTSGPIGTGALNISAGTSLFSDNTARTIANAVVVNGDFTFGGRTVGANLTLSGPINLGAVAPAMSVESPAVTVTLSGVLTSTAGSGVNGLTKTGNGTLVLTGANTDVSLGGAGITVAGGILRQGAANVVPVSSLLTVNAGAGFDLFGFDYPTNGFTGTGFITNSANTTQLITATITGTQSFAGKLADNSGNLLTPNSKLALTKAGAGTLVLNGASMNVGATTITAGLLELGAGGVLGTGAVDIQPTAIGTGFSINRADAVTLTNNFTSPGRFTQKGAGTTDR
jgi:autotransporter-associated beta strand protein